MYDFFQNIVTAIAYTIGVSILPTIIFIAFIVYQNNQQKKAATAAWFEIFKATSREYLQSLEVAEDYHEAASFKQLMESLHSQSLNSLRESYQLEYVERIFIDLESGEIKNGSHYIIKKNTS
jgi:hypothetical protein